MRKLRSFVVMIAAIVAVSVPAMAGEMLEHVDKADKFKISYPDHFKLDLTRKNLKAYVSSPENIASVGIMVQRAKISAADYIQAVEKKMGYPNMVAPGKRVISQKQAMEVGADGAALALFNIKTENGIVQQGWVVMTKGDTIYIMLQTVAESGKKQYGRNISAIAKTFRILD